MRFDEYPHAKSLEESIPKTSVPRAVRKLFVKVVCICYCGNGKGYKRGIDENALPYYESFIESFTVDEIKEFLKLFSDNEFVSDLNTSKADERMRELTKSLKKKTTNVHINKALDVIISFPKQVLPKIAADSSYKAAIKYV